jgi:hypothetical protein
MRADDKSPPKEKEEMDSNELSVIENPKIDAAPVVLIPKRVKTALEIQAEHLRDVSDNYWGGTQIERHGRCYMARCAHEVAAIELE